MLNSITDTKKYIETRRRYYLKNKDIVTKRNRLWASENKDKMREYSKKSKEKNRLKIKERMAVVKDTPEFKEKRSSYNKKYRGKYKDYLKKYYENNREKISKRSRNSAYKKKFGITIEEYDRMLISQNGVCAICNIPEISLRNTHFSVDHCHKTGKVRGLLCYKCNTTLGFVNDNTKVLKNAINYLNLSREKC